MNRERSDRVRLDMARWEAEILLGLLVDNSFHVGRNGKGIQRMLDALEVELQRKRLVGQSANPQSAE
jgi:hypothetical protein